MWLYTSFPGGAKPRGWAICLSIDRPGPWWTRSLMEKPTFTRASLSDVRVIMAIMHIFVGELLYQAVIGRIPVLECMLSGVCGHLWLHSIMSSMKWHCFSRTRLQGHLPGTREPLGEATGGPGPCQSRSQGGPSPSDRSDGTISGTRCMAP
jgi:hypothetical protein